MKFDRLVNEVGENEQLDKLLITARQMVDDMHMTVKNFRDMSKTMDDFIETVSSKQ